ncbi:hypothetical protein HDV00_001185 [Rhizophlyctis rosea]|nr:hypothetical protein HDV00_001185 [Rhizophlyctis rosea]
MHDFWTDLAWHRLLPYRFGYSRHLDNIDDFFLTFAKEPRRFLRLRRIWLDATLWACTISSKTVISLLSSIPTDLRTRITTIVINLKWDAAGSPEVLGTLMASKYSSVKRVHIAGDPTSDVYHGITSGVLRVWARETWPHPNLTHLNLDGFASVTNFSCDALKRILNTLPNLESLGLSYVRNGIDLNHIATTLQNLKSLAITFCTVPGPTKTSDWLMCPELHFHSPTNPFPNLESLSFRMTRNGMAPLDFEAHVLPFLRSLRTGPNLNYLRVPNLYQRVVDVIVGMDPQPKTLHWSHQVPDVECGLTAERWRGFSETLEEWCGVLTRSGVEWVEEWRAMDEMCVKVMRREGKVGG